MKPKALRNNSKLPLIMGILNVTDDSFFDGGKFLNADFAVKRAFEMVEEGADIIDVGGESSRPFSKRISAEEELRRVIPVLEKLSKIAVPISIDTTKPEVAEKAIENGVSIINDITALKNDKMAKLAAEKDVYVVLMHMQGTPADMQKAPVYADVVCEIKDFFAKRIENLIKFGIKEDKIIIDPGIGFGKEAHHNFTILKNLQEFKKLGFPVLLGCSKKTFIRKCLGGGIDIDVSLPEVEVASQAVNFYCAMQNADIVRVHNVKNTVAVLKIFNELS